MIRSRFRLAAAVVASLFVPIVALAHAFMDLGVTVDAPAYVRASQTERIPITADVKAFDGAVAVVITIDTDAQFTAFAAPSAWRCTRETKRVRCTADELAPGPHTFTVDVAVPASGSVTFNGGITSIGSDDPDFGNNNDFASSRVYQPSSCTASAPAILATAAGANGSAELTWSPVTGATSYDVYGGVDGETRRRLFRTTATSASTRLLGGGEISLAVRANFDGCPPIESAASAVTVSGPAERLAVASITSPLFAEPVGVAFWRNTVLVSDAGKRAILIHYVGGNDVFEEKFTGDIGIAPLAGDGALSSGPGEFLYVADRGNDLVRYAYPGVPRPIFTFAGMPRQPGANDGVGTAARVRAPLGVAVDARTRVYFSDAGNHTIRRGIFDMPKGEFAIVTVAGAAGQSGSTNGTGSSARFNDPAGMTIDANENVIIADRGNHTIRRMTPGGEVTTIAGVAGEAGHRDGASSQALFNRPVGVAVDARGNVYVTEEGNHTVRKIAPNGRVTTVAGQPGAAGPADGMGEGAQFNRPAMLAIDSEGTVWIADAGNGKLRRATLVPPPGPKRRSTRN
ncbi:MAG TPA: hypothetical protein VEU30_12540 [Thermoanaerobaculia bacterium]|nr:hypothetical protein [Thermoanaerobaculia bacterium]